MGDENNAPAGITELFEITPDGAYADGHKLLVTDEISVEHVDADFYIVALKLYVKNFKATEHHRVSKTSAAVYHYVHDATSEQA